MALRRSRFAASTAIVAALSLVATPALARGGGWGGGWGGGYRGGHGHNDDAGWIVGGILGIGIIAAIASSASKNNQNRVVDRSVPVREEPSRYERDSRPSFASGGISGAVDRCMDEIARSNHKIDTVDAVNRESDGWRVAGRTQAGRDFNCAIDTDGRIRSMTVDNRAAFNDEATHAPFVSNPVVQKVPG